jgi:hypothetical protein
MYFVNDPLQSAVSYRVHMKKFAGLEGWQIRAARAAARLGHRELAAESGVALSSIITLEKMETIEVAESGFKERGKTVPDVMERLLGAFERSGYRLVPRTATRSPKVERIE